MALALFAVSLDLVWGYTGLLSLGHGLYFGMGAYIVGYSLKLQKAAFEAGKPFISRPHMAMPDFMAYCRLDAVPGWIAPLINIYVALPLAMLLPTVAAAAFGYITFRRRIKGSTSPSSPRASCWRPSLLSSTSSLTRAAWSA